MNRALLAFDSGPGIGLGHQRRLEALAAALEECRVSTALTSCDGEDLLSADLVVVDSYRARADDTDRFRARVVAAVDDLSRDLDVDLIIDPNPGGRQTSREGRPIFLNGPAYALLTPSSATPSPVDGEVRFVLVSAGAADRHGIGAAIATEVAVLLPAVEVRLIVGPWGSTGSPESVVMVRAPHGLDFHLADADIVVTAGGVTMLESMRLGRPTVGVATADNQRRAVEGASAAGAIEMATVETAAQTAACLARDLDRRRNRAATAARYVDGHGAERVAEALVNLLDRR